MEEFPWHLLIIGAPLIYWTLTNTPEKRRKHRTERRYRNKVMPTAFPHRSSKK